MSAPQEAGAVAAGEAAIGPWEAVWLGLIEGLTEFLPVSSTGHLILATSAMGAPDPTFEVGIQVGAITAILVLYWRDVWAAVRSLLAKGDGDGPRTNLLLLILVAALPAAVVGLALEDIIEELLFHPVPVAIALVVGGVLLWLLERMQARRDGSDATPPREIQEMGVRDAFLVGVMQCLALIPGTSRSGATIAGGLLLRYSRGASAEFSFLVGLPILYGAAVLKVGGELFGEGAEGLSSDRWTALGIGTLFSFVAALLVVGPFVRFVRKHTFRPFAFYRIVLGVALLVAFGMGWL